MAIGTSGVSVPSIGQSIDTSIYGNKEAPKGMSLSDIVDLSRSSTALQKEKALLEPQIRAGKAAAETAETQASKSKLGLDTDFADKMRQQQIALINHPLIVQAEQDPQFAAANKDKIANLIIGQSKAAQELGLDPKKAEELNAPYLEAVNQTNGQGLRQFLKTRMLAGLDTQAQTTFNYPSATSVAGIPGYENRLQQTFSPISVNQQTQTGGGNQTNGSQNPQAVVAPQQIVQETFPNRANTPYVSDTEKPRFDEGAKTIQEAKIIGDAATTQLNDIRNARHYISQASGTALGQGTRSLTQLIKENPDLDSLIKSTAQLQMNSASRFGASTDAARETAAAAAGGANISEKALVRILDNAEADLTRDAKYSAGMQNFVTKRGNTGGTLNSPDFKQAWINNAKDRRIYQLININANPELSNAQKTMMRDELLKNENPATVKALLQQMKAMKQLEKGD